MSIENSTGPNSTKFLLANDMNLDELEADFQRYITERDIPEIVNGKVVYKNKVYRNVTEYNKVAYAFNRRNRYKRNVDEMIVIKPILKQEHEKYNTYNLIKSTPKVQNMFITDEYEWKTFAGTNEAVSPTINDLLRGITRAYRRRDSDYSSITLWFIDNSGKEAVYTLPGVIGEDGLPILGPSYTIEMVKEQLNKYFRVGDDIIEVDQQFIDQSDAYRDLATLDPHKFSVTFRRIEVGASVPMIKISNKVVGVKRSYKNGYKIIDFANENNSCLIEVFRKASNKKTTLTNAQIKKEVLYVEIDSMLGINHVPVLEEFFNVKVCVMTSCEYKKKAIKEQENKTKPTRYSDSMKNLKKFCTEVVDVDYYIYGEPTTANFWILFSDNHASLILEKQYKFFCPHSGEPVKKQGSKAKKVDMVRSLVESNRLNILKETEQELLNNTDKEKYYWFYDYETIVKIVDGDYLDPYAVACVAGIIDPVTKKFVEQKRYTHLGFGNTDLFINWLVRESDVEKDNLLIGYNSSRFDNLFLIEGLLKKNMINSKSLFLSANSILGLRFGSFRCLDLCRILCTPLKKACEDMKMDISKGVLSHNEVQMSYYMGEIDQFFERNRDLILDYNVKDCLCLAALYARTRSEIDALLGKYLFSVSRDGVKTNKSLDDFMTVSSITYSAWTNICKDVMIPKDYDTWMDFRSAVYGGRSQIFAKGLYHGSFQSVDAKSLYPYAMIDKAYPIGQEIKTDTFVEGKMGIYRCVIKSQPKVNIIPLRTKDEPLNWEYEGEINSMLCTVDIDSIKRHGGEIEIYEGYYWEESSTKVFDLLKVLKAFKTQQDEYSRNKDENYNPALRQLSKQLLNSLSGKVSQKIHKNHTTIVTSMKDEINFSSKHKNISIHPCKDSDAAILTGEKKDICYSKTAKTVHIGVFIYAYSRAHMYDALISKLGDNKFGMDTDALHVNEDEFNIPNEKGFGKFNLGDEFGDFEKEISFKAKRYYGVAPKCYCMVGDLNQVVIEGKPEYCNKCEIMEERRKDYIEDSERVYGFVGKHCDHNTKMRFKGVGKKDKILNMTKEDFMKLTTKEKTELYHSLEPALSEQLYSRLCAGEDVHIVCSQLRKTINNNNVDQATFNVNQIYMFKTIGGLKN